MLIKRGVPSEHLPTLVALVRFLTSVKSLVGHELGFSHKSFATVIAHKSPLCSMGFFMGYEVFHTAKHFPTLTACRALLFRYIVSLGTQERSLLVEGILTLIGVTGFFLARFLFVSNKIKLVFEGITTFLVLISVFSIIFFIVAKYVKISMQTVSI